MKPSAETLNVNFVKLVEANPCIWDNRSKDYRNKAMLRLAWNKISKEIDEPIASCSERWRKIRDAMFRSIKRHSIKKGHRKRKPYYLTPHLEFLLKQPKLQSKSKKKALTDNKRVDEYQSQDTKPGAFLHKSKSNGGAVESLKTDTDLESMSSVHASGTDPIGNDTQDHDGYKKQYFEMIDESHENSVLSKRWKLNNKNKEEDDNDSDMSFFKSLLRDVRKMNDKQNRYFRMRVLQVVDEILDTVNEDVNQEQAKPIHSSILFGTQNQHNGT